MPRKKSFSKELAAELEELGKRQASLAHEAAENNLIAALCDILNDLLPADRKLYKYSRFMWTETMPDHPELFMAKMRGDFEVIEKIGNGGPSSVEEASGFTIMNKRSK